MDPAYVATLPTKRTSAGLLFTDPAGRVLLVEPTYKPGWEIPGGAIEIAESPREGAVREVREELGLPVRPGRLLVVDWVPPREGRTDAVTFVFAGPGLTENAIAAIHLPPDELSAWKWCALTEADVLLPPLLARRVRAAVHAQQTGRTLYLEDGRAENAAQ